MDWNDETIVRLRDLWAEGHSTAEIGRRLGVSKNAVVGKAHRLHLAGRPSPIRRDGTAAEPRPAAPRRITGPTLPSMASAGPVPPGAVLAVPDLLARAPVAAATNARLVAAPPPVRAVAPRLTRAVACCWPLGEPGTPGFRFCDADAAQGKPYCPSHAAVAYVKVRDRREEAA